MFLGLNAVDWVVIVLALVVAVTGWSQGLLVGVLSFIGFVGGAVGGLLLVPIVLGGLNPGLGMSILAVLVVLVVAFVGQGVLAWLGRALRSRLAAAPARRLDAATGSLFAVTGLLVAAWAVGLAISYAAIPGVSPAVRGSVVLREVDDLLPVSPDRLRTAFRSVVEAGDFPEVVAPWMPEPVLEAEPPVGRLVRDPEVMAAAGSVVKVSGRAEECDRSVEGSGFVVALGRVMTNAHVVAGVDTPMVQVPGEEPLAAQVVVFDPARDIAVLRVPGLPELRLPALRLAETGTEAGTEAVVVGYPRNGPRRNEAARVRGRVQLLGRDIYGEAPVRREVLSLYADIGPGSSGGPVLGDDGQVYGVVFASSLSDPETGYALTPAELADAVEQAPSMAAVATGRCL